MKKLLKISLTLVITVIFVTGIIMPEIIMGTPASTAVGNWYQQFLPNLNGAQVTDMTFIDSLTGYIVTSIGGSNSNILKTTNGGDNWIVKFTHNQPFVKVKFINSNTGFTNAFTTIFKTTNAGENWTPINLPGIFGDDMFVLNQDTIWLAMSETSSGGVFRTTNGGASWISQGNFASSNPSHIYMYNARIGFIDGLKKTTNGGANWNPIAGGEPSLFFDMHFTDSLTGWKCNQLMKKTTDGGFNWVNQTLPTGGNIIINYMQRFSNVNKDTIWGVGGRVFYPGGTGNRGMIFRTTNGGDNWLYQIPDTSINIAVYSYIQFINRRIGWAYSTGPGIHTVLGGDTGFITGVRQISGNIPADYKLYQNYPNPFNPVTNIKYQITKSNSNVKLVIFDITGKEIINLVDREQDAGTYHVDFSGTGYSSGVYFYKLTVTTAKEVFTETKRMLMVK